MAEYTDNYGLIEPTYAELADIDPLNGNFETIDEIMHASQVSLADAYDLTETYNTGDVVMYQYYMYKCKEDNVTGAWDATKWERTTAGANGSGGGGTEVVANPVGTPTEDLQTIEIAGTIYDIPGGGGSGGGNFKITNLWNYTDDNSGTIPYGVAGPFTFHESLANYDAVFLELVSDAGDLSNQWRGSTFTPLLFITALDGEIEPGNINFTSYDQRSSHFVITRTTVQCTASAGGAINGLVNVWGVKFAGSGAFSAEIIPIGIGDGTTSRTFQLNRTPKSIIIQGYTSGDGGWYESGYFIWGSNFINLVGAQYTIATGGYAGQAAISYGADGKSFTITAANAFGAFNRADSFSGFLFVDYGEGGGAALDYSTDEQDTGKKWIDGKTIYQKTIILKQNDVLNFTYSNNEFLNCLPANIDYINIVQIYSDRRNSTYIDTHNNTSEVVIVANPTTQNLYFKVINDPRNCIVTIEYTKTTT